MPPQHGEHCPGGIDADLAGADAAFEFRVSLAPLALCSVAACSLEVGRSRGLDESAPSVARTEH